MVIPIVYVLLCLSTPELKLVLTLIFTPISLDLVHPHGK